MSDDDPTDQGAHDAVDEMLRTKLTEPQLREELERAYRCICGFHTSMRKGELLDRAAFGYRGLTIGAARRFVLKGSLDGARYFIGKNGRRSARRSRSLTATNITIGDAP